MNKLQTLAELLGSPENQAMFEMDNVKNTKVMMYTKKIIKP